MFCKAAEMSLKGDEKDDAANDFWTASKSYKKSNPERALALRRDGKRWSTLPELTIGSVSHYLRPSHRPSQLPDPYIRHSMPPARAIRHP